MHFKLAAWPLFKAYERGATACPVCQKPLMDAEPETQDASEQVGSLFQRLPRLVRPFAIVSLLPLAEGLLLVAMFLMKSVMESLGW